MQQKAFKDWVQPISNKLYLTALRLVVNREDARDIVQEAILKLWEKRAELDSIEYKEAWARRIVINKSLDWLKKSKPIYVDLGDDVYPVRSGEDIERQVLAKEKLRTVHMLVQRMSPVHRTIFELREVQGLSYKEIAESLNMDMNQVKVNLHRMRKKLKEHCETLEKYGIAKE
jgi:RNA polymerase sigma-70 factor (ECF subfamily)